MERGRISIPIKRAANRSQRIASIESGVFALHRCDFGALGGNHQRRNDCAGGSPCRASFHHRIASAGFGFIFCWWCRRAARAH